MGGTLKKRFVSFISTLRTKLKARAVDILARLANRLGYELIGQDVLVHADGEMPDAALKLVEGVKLLSLKVWTEGEKPCPTHDFRKMRVLNSHKNSVAASFGNVTHSDYTCSKCTHKMCVTEWGK
jgi:hypothetical protein